MTIYVVHQDFTDEWSYVAAESEAHAMLLILKEWGCDRGDIADLAYDPPSVKNVTDDVRFVDESGEPAGTLFEALDEMSELHGLIAVAGYP